MYVALHGFTENLHILFLARAAFKVSCRSLICSGRLTNLGVSKENVLVEKIGACLNSGSFRKIYYSRSPWARPIKVPPFGFVVLSPVAVIFKLQ